MPKKEAPARKINRVCFLNPQGYVSFPTPLGKTDTGGQIVYILQLAHALAKKNIKVDIFTRQIDNFDKEFVQEEQISPNINIIRIPCGPKSFVAKERMYEYMAEFSENIMRYMEKSRKEYDVIHSHYWDAGYAGFMLQKLLDIPHVFTPHTLGKAKKLEMSVEEAPVQKLKPFYRYHVRIALEQKIMGRANAVLALCETTRIQILQYYLVDFEKIHVVFPGVDTTLFNTKPTNIDRKIKLEENSILTTSRVVPAKGLDRVAEALGMIKDKVKFHWYLGGGMLTETSSDEEKAANQQLDFFIKKYKLENRVTRLGLIPHDDTLPAFYRKADLFILPSRYEPFGLTTLEAMACGTAPLVSKSAGSREVIIDGLNGYIVDTHDRKALSEKILSLLKDQKANKKIAENAAFTVKEHYDWDKIVDKIIDIYKKI